MCVCACAYMTGKQKEEYLWGRREPVDAEKETNGDAENMNKEQ